MGNGQFQEKKESWEIIGRYYVVVIVVKKKSGEEIIMRKVKWGYRGPWNRHLPLFEYKDVIFGECRECIEAREYHDKCGIWIDNGGNFHMEPIEWWRRRHNRGFREFKRRQWLASVDVKMIVQDSRKWYDGLLAGLLLVHTS